MQGKRRPKKLLSLLMAIAMVLSLVPSIGLTAEAATYSGTQLDGLEDTNIHVSYTPKNAAIWAADGTTITGTSTEKTTQSLYLYNTLSETARLSFDYEVTIPSGGSIEFVTNSDRDKKETITASGHYAAMIDSGKNTRINLKTAAGIKISLTNISLSADATADTTFKAPVNGTYTVDEVAITADTTQTKKMTETYALAAAPAEGYQFMGWYNETTGKYLGTETSLTVTVSDLADNSVIAPQFIPETESLYETGGQAFIELADAITYAQAYNTSIITMLADDTISGSYTIPTGITLLIPNDSTNTLYTCTTEDTKTIEKAAVRTATAAAPYRTLTLAEGASLKVQGAISLGGTYYAPAGAEPGKMVGGYGRIAMGSGSTITVESGGSLYAWGYVSGSGSVTVKSGGTVYEWFQIADFRGGNATMGMAQELGNKTNGTFFFSQYYIQNVEVTMTLEAGATENTYTALFAMSTTAGTIIPLIGDNGMFRIASGSLTKAYDGAADRQTYAIHGDASLNGLSLSVSIVSLSSAKYVLPITNSFKLDIASGSTFTVNQDSSLLPGVEVSIADGGEMKVSEGTSLYVYDLDEWGGYVGSYNAQYIALPYVPSRITTRAALADAKIDVNGTLTAAGSIYTTKSGANICSSEGTGKYVANVPGEKTETYQVTQTNNSTTEKAIAITPAQLKNGSSAAATYGEYTATAQVEEGTTFHYFTDHWAESVPVTITYDGNGGQGTMEEQTVTYGTDAVLSTNGFTRSGYTFTGWNTAANGTGTAYANGDTVNLTQSITLYAQWSCKHETTVVKDAVTATCSKEGYTGDTYCAVCGEKLAAGTTIAKTSHTSEVRNAKAATCAAEGYTGDTYCSVCGEELEKGETIAKTNHTPEVRNAKAATCVAEGYTGDTYCSVCGEELEKGETIAKTSHTPEVRNAKAATCAAEGYTGDTYCTVCGEKLATGTAIPKAAHSWGEGVITTAAGCTSAGVKTYTCANCGEKKTEAISPAGHTPVEVAKVAATCTTPGTEAGTKCSVCGAIISGLTEIPATGHTEELRNVKAATLTEDGYTGDTYCSVCGEKLASGTTIPKTGAKIAQGTVTGGKLTLPAEAAYGETVTVTATADSGYYLFTLPTVTTDSGASVELTKADNGTYAFTMPKENVTVSAAFTHLFDDVQDPASWYFNPVYWAVEKGITSGTGNNLFSPSMECSRAQIVTFLWNASGKPEPTTADNPFTDVSPSAWYYKAVLWAAENKITAGTTATTFSPDMKCSRAQIVTFLWNYTGKPAATQKVSFADVSESAWYYTAVQWAVENKVTSGTGNNKFSPDNICTRSQAVTFLYNDLNGKI